MAPRLGFIVYLSRSGSTFFSDRISRHPDVLVTPECRSLPILVRLFAGNEKRAPDVQEIVDRLYEDPKLRTWDLPKHMLVKAMEKEKIKNWSDAFHILCRCYRDRAKPKAKVILIKKGGWHYENIDSLLHTFHNAMVVWIFRDPRAVYNSTRKSRHSETGRPMSKGPVHEALRWRKYFRFYTRAKGRWGERVHAVYYERIVGNLQESVEHAWCALGVSALPENERMQILSDMRETHLVNDATRHLHGNVKHNPIEERVYGWRRELPLWESTLIGWLCSSGMKSLGYTGNVGTGG